MIKKSVAQYRGDEENVQNEADDFGHSGGAAGGAVPDGRAAHGRGGGS